MNLLEATESAADITARDKPVYDHVKAWNDLEPTPGGYKVRDVYGGALTLKWAPTKRFSA